MRHTGRSIASALAGLALMTSSVAGASGVQSVPTVQQASHPWMTLSMMTPVGATTLAAAGVAAEPSAEGPPPPEGDRGGGIGHIPLPVLAIWLGTIVAMVYIAIHDDKDRFESPD